MCHSSNEEFNIEYNLNSIKIYVNITMCKIVRSQEKKNFYEVKQKLNNFNFIHIINYLERTWPTFTGWSWSYTRFVLLEMIVIVPSFLNHPSTKYLNMSFNY